MKARSLAVVALTFAAALAGGAASAQLYKWVDENGITHYSDRKPDDPKEARNVAPVKGAFSVYTPDQSLLDAVDAARRRKHQPEVTPEPVRAPAGYAIPAPPPWPEFSDPCQQADCGAYYFPYAAGPGFHRRRAPYLAQAQFKPGAIAGTVNSPGIIPGNTGTAGNIIPPEPRPAPRPAPQPMRPFAAHPY